ncbi:SET and MYND domain-containing protein 4-like [Bradysia coprophila]|uniref:SET and MYND domain-containing protein 4-like n=1 Tax=Bradysia coprophila TaxID=38358 RepID=UPI00187D70FB|nr:SET and MYND domain-containing protein 4-like [Bradysia coprophila]
MSHRGDGQWSILTNVLVDKHFDVAACNFTNEVSVIELCQDPTLLEYMDKWLSKLNQKRQRTSKVANEYIAQGDKAASNEMQYDLAADYYTKAIFSAPKNSAELAIAHASRAGCLVTSERFYEEGYSDCKAAMLLYRFPLERLSLLFANKLHLAYLTEKEEYIAETRVEMNRFHIKIDSSKDAFFKRYVAQGKKFERSDDQRNVEPKAPIRNKEIIEDRNATVGRFLVTKEAIKQDEPVYFEKAFSFVPYYNYNVTDEIAYTCQHCGKVNCLPFPCYDCARASYCSPACRTHHEPIHKYECVGHQKNLWSKLGIGYLSFRTFLVGFKDIVGILEKTEGLTVDEVWSILALDWHNSFSYGNVLRLLTAIDKVDVKLVLRFALTAQMLTIYLADYTNFFKDLPPICLEIMASVDGWKRVISALLLKHLLQININGNLGTQLQLMTPTGYRKSYGYGSYNIHLDDLHLVVTHSVLFAAIFPTLCMANHSCDPNIRCIVSGMHMTAYATRNIGQNEELLISYGPTYQTSSTDERQMQLKTDFFFECKCNRCVSNDETWMQYFEYYCTDLECNVFVELDSIIDTRWWYYMDEPAYCDEIGDRFICAECGDLLPINPEMMKKFERAALGNIEKRGYSFHSTDNYIVTKNLLDLYFKATKCLGKYHELKARLSHMVLGYCILDSDVKLFPRLAYVTMESLVNREERYGTLSLEFILASTYALSILKMASRIEKTNTLQPMARDITKIRRILNLSQIEKSICILPESLQTVFRNIIRDIRRDMGPSAIGNQFNVSSSYNGGNGCQSEKSVG